MCHFKDVANCKEKICPYVKDLGKCPTFVKHYLLHLTGELIPFNYNPKVSALSPGAYFSRDVCKAKSSIARTAIEHRSRVKVLTISQILGAALDPLVELPDAEFYYIESQGKTYGEAAKIISCVQSQVEKMLLRAKVIVVCVPKDPALRLSFTEIK